MAGSPAGQCWVLVLSALSAQREDPPGCYTAHRLPLLREI